MMIKLVLICVVGFAFGRPNFRELIPNGFRVPCPEGQEENGASGICQGVGHLNCAGGGERNPFGQDFQLDGFVWSKKLCEADSDGDGIPNGVELGDPCCAWKQGDDSPDVKVSHPGFANSILEKPLESTQCDDVSAPGSEGVVSSSISRFESEGDDLYVFEYRMDEHVLPPLLNSYFNTRFNFPMDQTYDIIGMEPIIDNAPVLHHYVTAACNQQTDIDGIPVEQMFETSMTSCRDNFYNWAVGGGLIELPSNAGFRIGNGTDRVSFNLNIHYNNALQKSGLTDTSGARFFMTTKLRDLEIGSFPTGGLINLGEIPAGKNAHYTTTFCEISIDKKIAPDGIDLFSWLPHAHTLGKSIIVERLKKIEDLKDSDQVLYKNYDYAQVGYVSQEWNFDYNDQRYLVYPEGMKIRDGDLLATTCIFDSRERNTSTFGGQRTEDEMCIASQMYTPRQAVQNSRGTCAFGDRYSGDFPEGAKSILEVTLKEEFDYEQAVKDGVITCPPDDSKNISEVCEGFSTLDAQSLLFGSPSFQCTLQCATYLYQLFACDTGMGALRALTQGGANSGGLLGGLMSGSSSANGGGVLSKLAGNSQGGSAGLLSRLGGSSPSREGGVLNRLGGNSQGGSTNQLTEILGLLREDPSILIPNQCTNKMENYVEEQKIIASLGQDQACDAAALPKNLESGFQDNCDYVVNSGKCSSACAEYISNVYKCQSEGVAGLQDVAQMIEEKVGTECASIISTFQV